MSAQIIKGQITAHTVYDGLAAELPQLIHDTGRRPVLVSGVRSPEMRHLITEYGIIV